MPEGWLVVADQLAFGTEPGPFWGGFWVVDPDVDTVLEMPFLGADDQQAFPRIWGLTVVSREEVVAADSSADPAGLGLDGNPELDSGPGAVYLANTTTGEVRLISDGTLFDPALTPPMATVFAAPRDVLVLPDGDLLVVDADADPSGLGMDSGRPFLVDPATGDPEPVQSHVGYGALLRVDSETGEVSLVADGTNYAGAFPDTDEDGVAEPTVFLDPWAIEYDPSDPDAVFLLDTFADPEDQDRVGALFRVRLSTGEVEVITTDSRFYSLNDVAWKESEGGLLLLDTAPDLGDPDEGGAVFLVKWDGGAGAWVTSVWSDPDAFVFANGLIVTDEDVAYVVDFDADPFAAGAYGAVWLLLDIDPTNPLPVSSSSESFALVNGAGVPTSGWPSADGVSVPMICNNREVVVQVTGSDFDPQATLRGDGDIEVRSFTWISPGRMEARIFASCDLFAGTYDLRVVNPNGLSDTVGIFVDPSLGGGPPVSPAGDINADLLVDGLDLARIGMAFGGLGGCCDPVFDEDADLNDDGRVDGVDVAILASGFGRRVGP